jgi:hypothetical protein
LTKIKAAPVRLTEVHDASSGSDLACDAAEVCDLVGYTAITCSNVVDDFEGADFDKPVSLDLKQAYAKA